MSGPLPASFRNVSKLEHLLPPSLKGHLKCMIPYIGGYAS